MTTVALSARPSVALRRTGAAKFTGAALPRPAMARRAPVVVRAADDKPSVDTEELQAKASALVKDVQTKWEATEEKPAAIALAFTGFIAVWAASGVVGAVDSLPVVGDFFELVGLLVTGWFVYRYLLFGPDRAELKSKINGFIDKVSGK